jgi:hypothetical protein
VGGLNYFPSSNTGFGMALLAQIVLFTVRFIWKKIEKKPAVASLQKV